MGPWACVVPSLEELEREKAYACDDEHGCATGDTCSEGRCVRGSASDGGGDGGPDGGTDGGADAGQDAGTCTPGAPGALCARQEGVCAGARQVCAGGSFPACDDAVYAANDARYEPFERSCDGADNDCDGRLDAWEAELASGPGAALSRRADVVASGGGALALFEQGARIRARPLGAGGSLGELVSPAVSVDAVARAFAPSLATDGTQAFAAWIEQVSGSTVRVMLAPLDGQGGSKLFVQGQPAALGIDSAGAPEALAIAAGGGRILVAISDPGSTQAPLRVVGLPTVIPGAPGDGFTVPVGAPGVSARRPSVHHAGNGEFVVAFETPGGVDVWRVDADGVAVAENALQTPGLTFPQLTRDLGGTKSAWSLWVVSADAQSVLRHDCGQLASCGAADQEQASAGGGVQNLRVRWEGEGALATWDEGLLAIDAVFWDAAGAAAPMVLDPPGVTALRPAAVRRPGGAAVFFDTEGSSGGGLAGNAVHLQRLCL